eukprot:TRINITY_DN3862_c2_g1_i1.p1 TRINITY_DN3862_c2_g1~~TRINITY_DN3862_c2_g1_i1.p1  ORF type:complete len:369 (+),score=67.98 TRINITY_DN3862_c2_g1_i1:42-1109(+)
MATATSAPTCHPDAEAAKNAGNAAFSAGKYEEALEYYSQAIQKDPTSALLRSNRAGAFSSLGRHIEALMDADTCISTRPDWWKGYTRRGHALFQLQRYEESEYAFKHAQSLNPEEKTIEAALQRAAVRKAAGPPPGASASSGPSQGPRDAATASFPTQAHSAPSGIQIPTSLDEVTDFKKMSEKEIRQQLEQGLSKLSDEQLNAELVRAGFTPGEGQSRRDKIKILLKKPGDDTGVNTCLSPKAPGPVTIWLRAKVDSLAGPTRGEKLLRKRKRWLEEWNTWDTDQLLARLRKLGIDAEGNPRAVLIDLLLEAETDRLVKSRCNPQKLQFFGMVTAGVASIGTFAVVAAVIALGG